MNTDVMWATGNDDWATPTDLFAALDEEFGFRIDVAASAANTKVPGNWCGPDHAFAARRNGLTYPWKEGPVWCNPPYGRGIGRWMAKADRMADDGVVVVCLVPARVDTAWFHDYCLQHEVRFLRRRLKFNGHHKEAPFPSAVVVMGRDAVTLTRSERYDCEHCSRSFSPQRSTARYCSGRCRLAHWRARQVGG